MDRKYWEKIAPDYNEEIFDVLKNDKKGWIVSAIKKVSGKNKTVIDIGCAIGKWLPVLSPVFKKVYAIDISKENLEIAKKLHPRLLNVQFDRVDMARATASVPACDVAICINAILTDSLKKRNVFLKNINKCVKKNGYLILVVPSLESSLLTSIIRQQWNPDKDASEAIKKNRSAMQLKNILQGNAEIDDVPTKHYLKDELELLLGRNGFKPEKFHKIEYEWLTEFLSPPKWLRNPKPWDWMVMAKKL